MHPLFIEKVTPQTYDIIGWHFCAHKEACLMHPNENQFPNDIQMPHDIMLMLYPNNYFTYLMLISPLHILDVYPFKVSNILHNVSQIGYNI